MRYWWFDTVIGWYSGRFMCRALGIENLTCRGSYHCWVRHHVLGGAK